MQMSALDYADEIDRDFREQVRATGKHLHKIFAELLLNITQENKITIEEFAKSINYSDKQLRVWREGKAAIPIQVLVKIWKMSKHDLNELEDSIDFLKVYRGSEVRIPRELTPEIIEIIGRHCGDGSCTLSKNKDYRVTLTEHKSLIDVHNRQLKEIFNIEASVEKINQNIYKSIVNSKVYSRFFIKVIKIPSGNKTTTVKEPEIIKNTEFEKRKFFVRGLVDTEGSLYHDNANGTWVLEVNMNNHALISSISEVLEHYDIKHKILNKKNSYSLRIVGKEKIIKYFDSFGTSNAKYNLDKHWSSSIRETGAPR